MMHRCRKCKSDKAADAVLALAELLGLGDDKTRELFSFLKVPLPYQMRERV